MTLGQIAAIVIVTTCGVEECSRIPTKPVTILEVLEFKKGNGWTNDKATYLAMNAQGDTITFEGKMNWAFFAKGDTVCVQVRTAAGHQKR